LQCIEKETPDLIITDLWMPSMDGLVFIEHVRRDPKGEKIPVIIFSAKPFENYQAQAEALNVHHYIKKPATLEDILTIINPLLNA
jgi:two-component system, response regulator YesN